MTTIKTNCVFCGDVDLKPDQLRLFIYENAISRSYYEFWHQQCQQAIVRPASTEAINLLLTAEKIGLRVERIVIPAEALEEHVGFLITHDDVLDFTLELNALEFPTEMLVHAS